MKVLALASYPVEAAATRYRLQQFVKPLAERGITLDIRPFMSSTLLAQFYKRDAAASTSFGLAKASLLRLKDIIAARGAEVVMVQREAMLLGPPLVEWLTTKPMRRPLVLDLDDATYV